MAGDAALIQPTKKPVIVSAKNLARRPDSHLNPGRPLQTRRLRKSSFPRFGTGRRADAASTSGRSGPGTPLLRWKFEDAGHSGKAPREAGGNTNRKTGNVRGRVATAVSARKLAAGIWHLQLREATQSGGGGREATGGPIVFEHFHGDFHPAHACNDKNGNLHFGPKKGFPSSVPLHKFDAPMLPNHSLERATKWDAGCSRNSQEIFEIFSQMKLLEGQHVSTTSIVSSLQAELEGARTRIYELEAERQSSKKKLDSFSRKLAEEKASWCSREHEKVRAILDGLKQDLCREIKNRQRCEIVNSKLMKELTESKMSAKRLLQDYEKERKSRELMEEVCDELAKEIEEDKNEVEALKRDSMKIQEEVEEERKMLQMAEIWREERVQMKLLDAKLALENKYSKLSQLQAELVTFLRAWTGSSPDKAEIRQAEQLREAVNSVKLDEIKEFTYQLPPASEDILAVFDELQPKEEGNERYIEPCHAYSPASHDSNIRSVSPATDVFLEKPTRVYGNRDTEDESDWETLTPGEEQELGNSSGGSEPSVNAMCKESNASVSGMDGERSGEVYSIAARQPRKKGASITRLWRSSCPNNGGEIHKKSSSELLNGKVSDGRISNAALSPDCRLAESGLSPADQWTSPDSVNPHIARGMKGCIEWPRGSQKHSLKAKLLEARTENHKTQLFHVLRQKI